MSSFNSQFIRNLLRPLRSPILPLFEQWRERRKQARLVRSIDYSGQSAHDYIRSQIESSKPFMACRFGWNELHAVLTYGQLVSGYHNGQRYNPAEYPQRFHSLWFQAGFFPITPFSVARFYHRMMEDILEVDVLGSWMPEELELAAHMEGVVRVELHDLDPVIRQHDRPWTASLRGKRVLVVHPFDRSIRAQYAKRHLLFNNPDNLPEFELITLRAVQNPAWTFSAAESDPFGLLQKSGEFSSWFDALAHMEREIENIDFDVAIIGCGAYGLPLAAHVKRLGRQAVHLGGITQMLFGIKGDRWIKADYKFTGFNEHWVWPLPEETPAEAAIVEECGTYWGSGS